MNLYDILHISPDASSDEIRDAYRERIKESHPDRGGTDEDCRAVEMAYQVLRDPERRARYDQTGECDDPINQESQQISSLLVATLFEVLEGIASFGGKPSEHNVTSKMKELIEKGKKQIEGARNNTKKAIESMKETANRFEVDSGENILKQALLSQIQLQENNLEQQNTQLELADKTLEELKRFRYKHTPLKGSSSHSAMMGIPATWMGMNVTFTREDGKK